MSSYTTVPVGGLKLASGREARGSAEMAVLLPLFVEYLRLKHGIKLVLIKVAEAKPSAASASTHLGGWAVDIRSWNLTAAQRRIVIYEATRLGLPIYFRTKDDGFDPHFHGMVNVAYWTPCSYQISAMKNGRNGLRSNRVDRDREHRPAQSQWMLYKGAVAALRSEIKKLKTPTHTNDIEEYIMSMSPEAKAAFINEIALAVWNIQLTAGGKKSVIQAIAESNVKDTAQSAALLGVNSRLSALGEKMGVQPDENAIAQAVIAGISDKVAAAAAAAVRAHLGDMEDAEVQSIATAVVDELAARVAA